MKDLYLIRHAKSSWDMPLTDVLRPLANRGIKDTHLIGQALVEYHFQPFHVHISVSNRTQETFNIIKPFISNHIESYLTTNDLYTFSQNGLIHYIKNLPNNQNAILIFGHNYALTDFVNDYGSLSIDNLPTCGFIHLKFNIDNWQQLKKGQTISKIFPKDLK